MSRIGLENFSQNLPKVEDMNLSYEETSLIANEGIREDSLSLEEYRKHLRQITDTKTYREPEGFINLPFDRSLLEKVRCIAVEKRSTCLKYIIVVGIGGSNLGIKAVYGALYGFFDDVEPDRFPRIIFLPTTNSTHLKRTLAFLSRVIRRPEELIVNIVSKGGETLETVANAELLISFLKKRFPDISRRIVVTTGEDSPLWTEAGNRALARISIPVNIGGRYSVFSAVGIFPLLIAGLNVSELLRGASEMNKKCLLKYPYNPALVSASILARSYRQGKNIHDTFVFNSELESLGKWYRQLLGESVGKEKDLDGREVRVGITPTVSVGSTDLHSVGQLYLGGPKDKVTTFLSCSLKGLEIPEERFFSKLIPELHGKDTKNIMDAILTGVKIAYRKNKLSFMDISFSNINEYELGQFMQFKMLEVVYLAQLLNVNAFDQPNVVLYKKEVKKILKSV